ncbi:hypothetical protein ACXDF8_16530 [Mycolicibacterium sp. CBM1]
MSDYRLITLSEVVSDPSIHDYGTANLPAGTWAPTSWYPEWVSRADAFDVAHDDRPIRMRELVDQKSEQVSKPATG